MRIAFITEGGKDFGMGHVFRALTLAADLGRGVDVRFFTRSREVVVSKIETSGFKVEGYTTPETLIQKLTDFDPSSIVFDCLDVEPSMAQEIKQSFQSRVILFDNDSQANKHADTVINALISTDFTNRKVFDELNQTMSMLGPRYLILNKLFQGTENETSKSPGEARNILLAFGGSDPANRTTFVLERILQHCTRDELSIDIDIVLGPHFEYEEELNQIMMKNESNSKVMVHNNLPNLFEQVRKADLVITSPGLTMFESLTEGAHVIVLYQNDLQKRVYNDLFSKIGSDPDFFGLSKSGYYLDPNHEKIRGMQIGKGREEVIDAITQYVDSGASVSLRQVTDDDLKMIFDWRSDPAIYRYFYNQSEPLIWEEHIKWWSARSSRVDWIILVNETKKQIPVGSINCIDLESDTPEIGLFVGVTNQWGKSIGKNSVKLVSEWLRKRGYEKATARVMKENERSKRLFESLGFSEIGDSRPGEILYQKNL